MPEGREDALARLFGVMPTVVELRMPMPLTASEYAVGLHYMSAKLALREASRGLTQVRILDVAVEGASALRPDAPWSRVLSSATAEFAAVPRELDAPGCLRSTKTFGVASRVPPWVAALVPRTALLNEEISVFAPGLGASINVLYNRFLGPGSYATQVNRFHDVCPDPPSACLLHYDEFDAGGAGPTPYAYLRNPNGLRPHVAAAQRIDFVDVLEDAITEGGEGDHLAAASGSLTLRPGWHSAPAASRKHPLMLRTCTFAVHLALGPLVGPRVEAYVHRAFRDLLVVGGRAMIACAHEFSSLSIADVRALELRTKRALESDPAALSRAYEDASPLGSILDTLRL